MLKRLSVLCFAVLMIFSLTVQGYASNDNTDVSPMKVLKTEIKQSKEGLIEEGTVEVGEKQISYKKIDRKDGTIEITTIEDGKSHIAKIDKSKGEMDFDGTIVKLDTVIDSTPGLVENNNETFSVDWVHQASYTGSTIVDDLVNASLSFIASVILFNLPGAIYMTMATAMGLASIWQGAYATVNILYYSAHIYRDFNPPYPYPYRDKHSVDYYSNSGRTDLAFSDEWIEYPILP